MQNKSKIIKKAEFSFDALYKAYLECKKHKSATLQAMRFEFEREKNLKELYYDILNNKYEIGKSICFIVTEPKFREVWAGMFRDRIVHHLIYNAIYDRFVSKFIYNTYSCIPRRGTLKAAQDAQKAARNLSQNYSKKAYFLKMDIKNYFVSIDKTILYNQILNYVDEEWLIDLIQKVIFHDPRTNVYMKSPKWMQDKLPKYKSLFNTDISKGLPIGNLTSQFFSNIYLNNIDQYAKHVLKCKHYFRYVDDILLLDEDAGYLNWAYSEINRYLIDNLNLELNHKKKNINLINKGFDFVGYVIKPDGMHIRRRTVKRCYKTINEWKNSADKYSKEGLEKFRNKINSYFGMFWYTNAYNFRKNMAADVTNLFIRSDAQYSKIELCK